MISYQPKSWYRTTFAFTGTVIPRVVNRVALLTAFTAVLWLLRDDWPELAALFTPLKSLGHSLAGVALGLLVVLRTNSANDRFWEGRKLWGAIVNTARNLVRGATTFAGDARDLAGLVAAYALALKQLLRGSADLSEVQPLVPPAVFARAASSANPPATLAHYMSAWVRDRQTEGKIDSITAQALEDHVRAFLDHQGGCERILRTPIPFAYAVQINQMLLIYLITLPFVLIAEEGWLAIPTVAVIAFGLLGIEEAGVEIEDPFGTDPNDLPLEDICATIARDARALAELDGVAATEAA